MYLRRGSMSSKVDIVVAIDGEAARVLKKDGVLTDYKLCEVIPESFKWIIKTFMVENVGFETGPIFCLARMNGEPISLKESAFDGDLVITDLLPISAGDFLLELSVDADVMVSIDMDQLFYLTQQVRELGDNRFIEDMLKDSLRVGAEVDGADNIFSFIPEISKSNCTKFFQFDNRWNTNYSDIFSGMEEVRISELSKFC